MTSKLYEHVTYVVRENNELTANLQRAEIENARLQSENEQLKNGLLALGEKLADANNEIDRLGMILKHRARDRESAKRLGKQREWPLFSAHQH